MKVFLDTNVLVSGFGTRGLCADVVREVLAKHELLVAPQVLAELTRTLAEKFGLPAADLEAITGLLSPLLVADPPAASPVGLRDSTDEPIVAAAAAAGADVFVTGDKDILAAKSLLSFRVADPREFWNLLKNQRPNP